MNEPGPMKQKLSIIVVSYNTIGPLRKCLQALEPACRTVAHETIVVDNASTDGSVEMVLAEFPTTTLVTNSENRGFGAANNQGIDSSTGELLLFLNSDAYAQEQSVSVLVEAMANPHVVAVGGKLLHPDGSLQESAANGLSLWAVFCEQSYLEKLFRNSKLFSPYWVSSKLPIGGEVEQVMGACLMMRRGERFDERFFLYCEDTELCKRLRKLGAILYVPQATFVHELGSSSASNRWKSIARYNRGKELYFRIHHGAMASASCWILDRFGALLRFVIWSLLTLFTFGILGTFRSKAWMFLLVLLAPIEGPPRG